MPRTIEVKTLDGFTFRIKLDNGADNCWSVALPDRFAQSVHDACKYRDEYETLADGSVVWYSGSLTRVMTFVAEYIGESEA